MTKKTTTPKAAKTVAAPATAPAADDQAPIVADTQPAATTDPATPADAQASAHQDAAEGDQGSAPAGDAPPLGNDTAGDTKPEAGAPAGRRYVARSHYRQLADEERQIVVTDEKTGAELLSTDWVKVGHVDACKQQEAGAEAWLNEHYPQHADPAAYWAD